MNDYKTLQPFRYWCQKVLPLVYDDSLSYYELLCKVVDYLNNVINDINIMSSEFNNLQNKFNELKLYVENYFSNLDVQNEINNKLDEMVKSGEFQIIFDNYLNRYYGFISVLSFGADPTGTSDSSKAFADAITKANETNGAIGIPVGIYLISDNLPNLNTGVSLIGLLDSQNDENSNSSIIIDNRESNTALFNFEGGSNSNTIKNLTFWCRENENNTENICIKGTKVGWDMRIENCTFSFFDCALYLDGNDLQMESVKIAFCGKNNYAFHLGTNSSMISKLHIEHCRLMLETPSLYTFANHITSSKFEMSTFNIKSNKPYILLNGFNKYGLINFTDCNFYCLDYLAFLDSGIMFSEVPYMIDTGNEPSTLRNTKYKCVGFYNCNFNIGAGSGAYVFTPISNTCKYLKCSKVVQISNCCFHNLSGDIDSLILYNSYSDIKNNALYFDFTDFRNSMYGQYCNTEKKLITVYNATFIDNIIYYDDSVFKLKNFQCTYPNKYVNVGISGISVIPVKSTNLETNNIKSKWILLYEIQCFNGCGVCANIEIADKYNNNYVNYLLSCIGSTNNINTATWKLSSLFKSNDDEKICITAKNNLLKIYYYIGDDVTGRVGLLLKENIVSASNVTKHLTLTYEEPDKTGSYLEA